MHAIYKMFNVSKKCGVKSEKKSFREQFMCLNNKNIYNPKLAIHVF